MRIDAFTHFYPPKYYKRMEEVGTGLKDMFRRARAVQSLLTRQATGIVPRMRTRPMNSFLTLGAVGLAAQVLMNLIVILAVKSASARFFTESWWSAWFPTYVVWIVFLCVGLGRRGRSRGGDDT